MYAYVLIVVISQGIAGSGTTQHPVGEFPSMEQCRKAARGSEVVHTINDRAGPKPRMDYICVQRSKL